MSSNRWRLTAMIAMAIASILAACSPLTNLPAGPTPIPTLVPATDVAQGLGGTATPAFAIMSYPAQLPMAAQGAEIYQAECVTCHGVDGTGAIPEARNFRDLDYMRAETPASFYVTVTEGRGGMPSYQERLSSDERWDVVFYLWRLSTTAPTLEQGQQIYEDNCAVCHGLLGNGEQLGSADFTNLRQMDQLAPRDLYLTVTQGRGSMPSWQARLSQDERWAVIDYLRTFSYDPTLSDEPEAPAPTDGEAEAAACDSDQANPLDWDEVGALAAGQEVFGSRCSACHGEDGSGALASTPDFTELGWAQSLRSNPGPIFCIVANGQETMPGFGDVLDDSELWQVITFLGSLGPE